MNNKESNFKNQLCFPIYLCSKEITGIYTKLLKSIDLTYTQYVVMIYLWKVGKSNLKDASKALMLDASTISPILAKLEKKGFIKKERDSSDERNLIITVTKKGESIKDEALEVPEQVRKLINISDEDYENLCSLTRNIIFKIRENKE